MLALECIRHCSAPYTPTLCSPPRSGELQNLWYHMDRNEVTRAEFRRILLEAKDTLPVTFPASPCPYPAAPSPPTTPEDHVAGGRRDDGTAAEGIPVSGAGLQRARNRATYEDNVRRAAGSAMTYGVVEEEGRERCGVMEYARDFPGVGWGMKGRLHAVNGKAQGMGYTGRFP